MNAPEIEPLVLPSDRELQHRSFLSGVPLADVRAQIVQERTGGHRTTAHIKLETRREKAQAELDRIAEEEARQLGIAAEYRRLENELGRLQARWFTANQSLKLHKNSVVASRENARLHLGLDYHWSLPGDMILGQLNQKAVVAALTDLNEELAAEVAAKQGEVNAFAAAHGITEKVYA